VPRRRYDDTVLREKAVELRERGFPYPLNDAKRERNLAKLKQVSGNP